MIEMVERVARALVYWSGDDPDALVHPSKPLPVTRDGFALMTKVGPIPLWQTKVELARLVIAAMREPSEAMIDEADAAGYHQRAYARVEIRREWQDMIDVSLRPAVCRERRSPTTDV